MAKISVASTEYVHVAISSTDFDTGLPVALGALSVQLAFVPDGITPTLGVFQSAAWDATATKARTLVGPGGYALAVGKYKVWWRIVDSPEIPVQPAPGVLEVF